MMQILNPETVFSDNKESLARLVNRFPNIIDKNNLPNLDLKWRELSNFKSANEKLKKNGFGEQLFPNS